MAKNHYWRRGTQMHREQDLCLQDLQSNEENKKKSQLAATF